MINLQKIESSGIMKFTDYISIDIQKFRTQYIDTGLVQVGHHDTFPLSIYSYGRKAVHEEVWDAVTTKCRGIVVSDDGNVIARPFEKFHNFGSSLGQWSAGTFLESMNPIIWEKIDGFMITAFKYRGEWHAASKGSFHSIHAKWATAELRRHENHFPEGFTPVFEGLHPDLRIVVDYGKRQELVLLALINIKEGGELLPNILREYAVINGYATPRCYTLTLEDAKQQSLKETKNEEGYVLTWYQSSGVPIQLKMKFVEYLRLHRMVCGVSPKRIWECLSSGLGVELEEYLNDSTPWFAAFTKKWVKALRADFDKHKQQAESIYRRCEETLRIKVGQKPYASVTEKRKEWAIEFQRPENEGFQSILFSMLDKKDYDMALWKKVKEMTTGANPMVDSHTI
jgi:RNA ligase